MNLYCQTLYLLLILCCLASGCSTIKTKQDLRNGAAAKRTFAGWNMRAALGTPREACQSPALRLASMRSSDLEQLLDECPAPDATSLNGDWKGINKGIVCAFAGITQDVKSFRVNGCCVTGFNKSVHQVPIDHLDCCGWRQQIERKNCQPVTMGNFVVRKPKCCNEPLILDYTIADNPLTDPSRFLIDEIVQVDRNLLLGRAYARVGWVEVPIAWFILYRDGCGCNGGCECAANCCDSPCRNENSGNGQRGNANCGNAKCCQPNRGTKCCDAPSGCASAPRM